MPRIDYDPGLAPSKPEPRAARITYVRSGAEAARLDAERTRASEAAREAEAEAEAAQAADDSADE
jgi:hypothetical protein